MNRHSLTVLLAAVFTAHAAGLTGAIHLAMKHCAHADQANVSVDGGPERWIGIAALHAELYVHKLAHDPAHCAICQALAAFKTLHVVRSVSIAAIEPSTAIRSAARAHPLNTPAPATLGPRAPPAAIL